jgi:hypothetical protein
MNKQDKLNKNSHLILSNPQLSATKLYEKSKALGLGTRKQDFLKLVRDLRHIPEKTTQEKEKYIPTKYKDKPKVIKTDTVYTNKQIKKKTQYGLSEITAYMDNNEQQTFYIKYKNKKDFNRQLDVILQHYKIQSYEITNHGVYFYKPFIDSGFQDTLMTWNIKV